MPAVDEPFLDDVLRRLRRSSTHHDVEHELRAAGWTPCGAGDWAFALAAPRDHLVARISPFDPVGPYTARLYAEAANTHQVPRLLAHRRLAGGGDLQVMERLTQVSEPEAAAFLARLAGPDQELLGLSDIVHRIHAEAQRELPWCGPLDDNPSNVMRRRLDGRLVLIDPYYADGPNLYAAAENDPDLVVARIAENQRRYMTDIPLAGSGPWQPGVRDAIRQKLRLAEVRGTNTRPPSS